MYVEYSSNDSGRHWWLEDEDWLALEKAGWKVWWHRLVTVYDEKGRFIYDEDGLPILRELEKGEKTLARKDENGNYRYLGCLAAYAFRAGLHLREAVAEWERVTGKDSASVGCSCCGQPHYFTEYGDKGEEVDAGPHENRSMSWD